MKPKKFSIIDRLQSFGYAFSGLLKFFKQEHNARIHLVAICIVLPLGWYFKLNRLDWSFLLIAIALVIITELINTAVETICDLVEPNYNEAVKDTKDFAAGATLMAALVSFIIGIMVFAPKIWDLPYFND